MPMESISACQSGMTLSTVSNKTWLNVEATLNSGIGLTAESRAQGRRAWVDITQRELDWHKKTIGMYEGLVRKLRAEHGGGRLIEGEPRPFDYGIPAEL